MTTVDRDLTDVGSEFQAHAAATGNASKCVQIAIFVVLFGLFYYKYSKTKCQIKNNDRHAVRSTQCSTSVIKQWSSNHMT